MYQPRFDCRQSLLSGLTGAVFFGLCACQSLGRLSECELLIEEINSGLADIREVMPDAGALEAPAYQRIAERYAVLRTRVKGLNLQDAALMRLVEDYRAVLERADARARGYAEVLTYRPKGKRAQKARRDKLRRQQELARGERSRETSVVRRLDELCHPR